MLERANNKVVGRLFIEQGVAFVPGAPFYAANPDLSTFRLSFATADVGKIEEGVGRLGLFAVHGWRGLLYMGGGVYLIDRGVADISANTAILVSLGTLAGGWLVYDLLWASPLGNKRPALAGLLSVGAIALAGRGSAGSEAAANQDSA